MCVLCDLAVFARVVLPNKKAGEIIERLQRIDAANLPSPLFE